MAFDPDIVRAVTFDSFSTLVDPTSAARALTGTVDDPAAVAGRWHSLAVRYAMVANYIDAYEPYYDVHRDALAFLLESRGVSVSDDELAAMTDVYHDLEPFEDVREGMARLDDAGVELAILSNGDPALLDSLLDTAGIEDLTAATISADEIRRFKPARELYEHAADRLSLPLDAIAHVSAGWADVQGAKHAGMQGVWIDRRDRPWPRFGPEPDLTVASLHRLAAAVGAE